MQYHQITENWNFQNISSEQKVMPNFFPCVHFHTLCMQAAKALANFDICTGSLEPWLLDNSIRKKISCAGCKNGMGCFVQGDKNSMGCYVRGDKNSIGCFVLGGKSLWDVLSRVAKYGMGCFVPGCFVLLPYSGYSNHI